MSGVFLKSGFNCTAAAIEDLFHFFLLLLWDKRKGLERKEKMHLMSCFSGTLREHKEEEHFCFLSSLEEEEEKNQEVVEGGIKGDPYTNVHSYRMFQIKKH